MDGMRGRKRRLPLESRRDPRHRAEGGPASRLYPPQISLHLAPKKSRFSHQKRRPPDPRARETLENRPRPFDLIECLNPTAVAAVPYFQSAKLRRGFPIGCPRQVQCRMTQDYHDFTMGSIFGGTDQPPTRSALLIANWRGCETANADGERLGGLQVDNQLEFGRLLDGKIGRLGTAEDPSGVNAGLAKDS